VRLGFTASLRRVMKNLFNKFNGLFIATVIIPTACAILYFGLIASDVYISESHFVVRSPQKPATSGFGAILQSAGFSRSDDDTYTVHDFMRSRDAMSQVNAQIPLQKAFREGADIFSRFNPIGLDGSNESLHRYYQKQIGLDLDSASSISILRTRAFNPEDAYQMNQMLLKMGETLINQLNERGRQDMIHFANSEVKTAAENAQRSALSLASYRNDQRVFDPEKQSALQLQQISKMQEELIANRAQLAQVQAVSPANPQIPSLQKRIGMLQAAINSEMSKVTGADNSLTNKSAEFTRISQDALLADKQLALALTSLEQARNDAQRKQLYLERIVQPSNPDKAIEPHRLKGIFATLILGLIAWGIATILLAGVREHQD
jgi:capsular polysaccharide transport system permease protein